MSEVRPHLGEGNLIGGTMSAEHEAEWLRLFELWEKRLLRDDGWEIAYVVDSAIGELRAQAEMNAASRKATIRFNPDLEPRNATACHEFAHLLMSHFTGYADEVARTLDGSAAGLALIILDRQAEETTAVLTARFLAAYGEE